ncbi:hypothetical protein BDU57DRAFT_426411, partial [Ampelomyces quisqualis]
YRVVKSMLLLAAVLSFLYTLSLTGSDLSIPESSALGSSHTLSTSAKPVPIIGKVTASFGPADPVYEAAISTHAVHNSVHGYAQFVLREQMVRGLWSKHAYLLTIIGNELAKPEAERLKWLFWHDRDTVVMNSNIPLSMFLPPESDFGHINLIVTRDRNGLNNGVFFVRVSQWALKMFASTLSIREYLPEVLLKYTEQSGMEETIKRPWWNSSVAYVPQRWFNGFPPNPRSKPSTSSARLGSVLIHFASNRDGLRPERMAHWSEIAQNKSMNWYKTVNETGYPAEIAEYW